MTHPTVTFTDPTHERVTRRIAEAYEARQQARRSFYRPTRWDDLPQGCQQEHADIATAALSGTTYNGHELPQWVKNIANHTEKVTPMTSPKRYRKKPVTIESMPMPREKYQGNVRKVAEWMAAAGYDANPDGEDVSAWDEAYVMAGPDGEVLPLPEYGTNFLEIETLEGTMTARPGDYIIRGVQGEFYPVKPDIFHATYEEVSND